MSEYRNVTRRRKTLLAEKTHFAPLDLVASLGINHFASKYATLDNSFRLAIYRDANGDVPAWSDLRFLGGATAVLFSQFYAEDYHPLAQRVSHDLAVGLLSSFVSTETCRAAAVKRMVDQTNVSELAEGSTNVYTDEQSQDWSDDPHLEDIYGNAELDFEEEQVSYAYGW